MTVWRKGGGGTFVLIFTGIPYVISSHCEILRFGSSVRKKWKQWRAIYILVRPFTGTCYPIVEVLFPFWSDWTSLHLTFPTLNHILDFSIQESTISPFVPIQYCHLSVINLIYDLRFYEMKHKQIHPLLISQNLPKSTISH